MDERKVQNESVTEAPAQPAEKKFRLPFLKKNRAASQDEAARAEPCSEMGSESTEKKKFRLPFSRKKAAANGAGDVTCAPGAATVEGTDEREGRTAAVSEERDKTQAEFVQKGAKLLFEHGESYDAPVDPECLLEVRNLRKYFPLKTDFFGRPQSWLRAVDDISFRLKPGKTLGIVGESGCGKTTMGRTILKLHEPTDGKIIFGGEDIAPFSRRQMNALRTKMQIIFQDPYSSLQPRMPVGSIIGEAVRFHRIVPKAQAQDYIMSVMEKCGLRDYYYERYPHEFSGGQRQRICIARALAVKPQLIVCDEPVSALDVSIQAQIINLLKDLQESENLAYLFISHDLSVVKHISDQIGVMYLGSMAEFGDKDKVFANPMHPYTQALFSAVPVPDPKVKMKRIILNGDIPSPANPPKGCKFHTRCPYRMDVCEQVTPVYREYEPDHCVACHLYPQD